MTKQHPCFGTACPVVPVSSSRAVQSSSRPFPCLLRPLGYLETRARPWGGSYGLQRFLAGGSRKKRLRKPVIPPPEHERERSRKVQQSACPTDETPRSHPQRTRPSANLTTPLCPKKKNPSDAKNPLTPESNINAANVQTRRLPDKEFSSSRRTGCWRRLGRGKH